MTLPDFAPFCGKQFDGTDGKLALFKNASSGGLA